jgi:hypothetical protein
MLFSSIHEESISPMVSNQQVAGVIVSTARRPTIIYSAHTTLRLAIVRAATQIYRCFQQSKLLLFMISYINGAGVYEPSKAYSQQEEDVCPPMTGIG